MAIGLAERIDALDGLQAAADEEQIHIHSEDPTEKIRTGACAAGDHGNIDVVECVPGTTTLKLTGSASVGEQWSVELTYRTGRILPLTQGESYTVVQSTADWFQLEAGDTGTAIILVAAGKRSKPRIPMGRSRRRFHQDRQPWFRGQRHCSVSTSGRRADWRFNVRQRVHHFPL